MSEDADSLEVLAQNEEFDARTLRSHDMAQDAVDADFRATLFRRVAQHLRASRSSSGAPDGDSDRRLDAIERAINACAAQVEEGVPPSRWVVDYAGILAAYTPRPLVIDDVSGRNADG